MNLNLWVRYFLAYFAFENQLPGILFLDYGDEVLRISLEQSFLQQLVINFGI